MKHKGAYYGFKGGHIEYHTVNPKKEKAADCIYLTTERECQNKKCPNYFSKCFDATGCGYRVKEKDKNITKNDDAKKTLSVETPKIKSIVNTKCSVPKGSTMYHKKYGQGKYIGFEPEKMILSVDFKGKIVKFKYPQAIFDKFLIVPKNIFEIVLKDEKNAKKEFI